MNANLKTHLSGVRAVLHTYFMGVAVSWAGFPIICFVSMRLNWYVDRIQIFYTVFALLVYTVLAYLSLYDLGEHDRRPYRWARYKAKGAVCGLLGFAVIYLLELLLIVLADKYIRVQHPILNIEGVHGYVTQLIYMPFFWLYKLFQPEIVIPSVSALTALLPAVYITAVCGFAYWMGYTDKVLIKHKPQGKLAGLLFYGRARKKTPWRERLLHTGEKKKGE